MAGCAAEDGVPLAPRACRYGAGTKGLASAGRGAFQPYLPLKVEGYEERALAASPVELVYAFRSSGQGASPSAVPDGCVDLSFGFGPDDVLVTIGGTVLSAKGWDFAGERSWVGCRFRPGEAVLPSGIAPEDLVDHDIELDSESFDPRLAEALFRAKDARARMDLLAACFGAAHVQGVRPGTAAQRRLERFCRAKILSSGGMAPIAKIAEEADVSVRYLRRAFLAVHGISPKQFARFVRFQRAMGSISGSDDATQARSLALACGYSDQSHLVHEFNEFAGMTPGKFRQLVCSAR